MADRSPGQGRYARLEREQRWIASGVPAGASVAAAIIDRYVEGTRLRLRRSETSEAVVHKLGQKVRVGLHDPEMVKLTNIYLSQEEHAILTALPAGELRKTRWAVAWHEHVVVIDQYRGRHEGLVLAEVELAAGEERLPAPPFTTMDVTNDDRFSGGSLAFMADDLLGELLAEVNRLLA